ncbi:MAG: hypothetical protein Q7R99_01580 [bacterium]|nr:hypothetical protein [bacterium]
MKKKKEEFPASVCQWMLLKIVEVSGEKGATVDEIFPCVHLLSERAREKFGKDFLFWLGPTVSIEDVLGEMACWDRNGLVDYVAYLGRNKRYFITTEGVNALNDWLGRILSLFGFESETELVDFIQQAL